MSVFNLALIQMLVETSKEKNLEHAEKMIDSAVESGADVVVLPEMFNCPYDNCCFSDYAETDNGKTVKRLSRLASDYKIVLIGGSIPEKASDGKIFNTCFCFNKDGDLIERHRKLHLFDVDIEGGISFHESETLSPGNRVTVIDTEFGKIGVAICFDIRFAEMFREMAIQGVHTIIVPGAFNMTTGPAHWELSFRMRAVDNQVFMAGCAPARNHDAGYLSWGNSLITDPWGDVMDSLDEEEGILIREINTKKVYSYREQLPILKGFRKDYSGILM